MWLCMGLRFPVIEHMFSVNYIFVVCDLKVQPKGVRADDKRIERSSS